MYSRNLLLSSVARSGEKISVVFEISRLDIVTVFQRKFKFEKKVAKSLRLNTKLRFGFELEVGSVLQILSNSS